MKIHLTAELGPGDHHVVDVIDLPEPGQPRLSTAALALLIQTRRDALESFTHHLRREIARLDRKQAEADVAKLEASRQ